MPFVRFARDRRGYETLYVMHAFETGQEGRTRPRVLYACRSVPYARVGRAALDEAVQRRIETAYPNLRFDWPRLLKEAAAAAPRPDKTEERRGKKKGKQPKRPRSQQPAPEARPAPGVSAEPAEPAEPVEPVESLGAPAAEEPEEPEEPGTTGTRTEPMEPVEPVEPMEPQVPEVQVQEVIGPLRVDPSWPVVALIGETPALILRGRYIEIAHRVLSRVDDPAERRRLLAEAARLNPETWTTADAAREGVARFDAAFEALASRLRQPPAV